LRYVWRNDKPKGTVMTRILAILALVAGTIIAWAQSPAPQAPAAQVAQPSEQRAVATFAGGCFWCVEADFDKVDGVVSTTSGYTGGKEPDPTYAQVSSGRTSHTEAVEIVYDPAKVTYATLLDVFWRNHDPLAKNRQFCDSGPQYRAGIFFHNDEQRKLAEETKKQAQAKFAPRVVHTEVTAASQFYKAEDYHQDYHAKNPVRYKFYRYNCGRDQRLEDLWGKSDKSS
jgi:peptide-methionine (S)-S-oxide reductase